MFLIEIRFIKLNLTSRAYQTKLSPLEGLARPRALPRPPPYGAVERSARAWSPALQTSPVFLIEIRFIKLNLTSRAYQTKLSPLEGLARPRAQIKLNI